MNNQINWSKVGVYASLVIGFCIGGLKFLGVQVPDGNAIIEVLIALAALLHGPAVTSSVKAAFAKASANACTPAQCPTGDCCTK